MDKNIVLGKALIEAYKLETEEAIYPRIILSNDVIKVVREHIGYYSEKEALHRIKNISLILMGTSFSIIY